MPSRVRPLLAAAALSCASAASAAERPRLTGIIVAGPDRLALFAGPTTMALREGDRLGEEQITAIDARAVHLDGPAGACDLELSADGVTRSAHAISVPAPSVVDPYWRERETENDQ